MPRGAAAAGGVPAGGGQETRGQVPPGAVPGAQVPRGGDPAVQPAHLPQTSPLQPDRVCHCTQQNL